MLHKAFAFLQYPHGYKQSYLHGFCGQICGGILLFNVLAVVCWLACRSCVI
jgi:hypothetical protein